MMAILKMESLMEKANSFSKIQSFIKEISLIISFKAKAWFFSKASKLSKLISIKIRSMEKSS
jgi:hypothetical protein